MFAQTYAFFFNLNRLFKKKEICDIDFIQYMVILIRSVITIYKYGSQGWDGIAICCIFAQKTDYTYV